MGKNRGMERWREYGGRGRGVNFGRGRFVTKWSWSLRGGDGSNRDHPDSLSSSISSQLPVTRLYKPAEIWTGLQGDFPTTPLPRLSLPGLAQGHITPVEMTRLISQLANKFIDFWT